MKNLINLMVFILLSASLRVAQKSSGSPNLQSEVEREIRKLTQSWDRAMVKRDVSFLDSILSDDYITSGLAKPQYLELIKSSEIKHTSFDREIILLRLYGDTPTDKSMLMGSLLRWAGSPAPLALWMFG